MDDHAALDCGVCRSSCVHGICNFRVLQIARAARILPALFLYVAVHGGRGEPVAHSGWAHRRLGRRPCRTVGEVSQRRERYVSLLRHIHLCREEDGSRSYDHIVIVAHSLGSLITADLLRFLHLECMPGLTHFAFAGPESEGLPIYFFSMGCPLRQLLSRFFPHLYRWIREVPEDSGISWPVTQPGAPIPAGTPPLPSDLRVKHWVNFYRSGDYVGRSIWTNEVFGRTAGPDNIGAYPDPVTADTFPDHASLASAERVDACIGLGAHTHYWDR